MKLAGIYPITDDAFLARPRHGEAIRAVLDAGVAMLQFRAKHGNRELARGQAAELLAICRGFGTPLIINDDVDLCAACGADGVHLGAADGSIARARRILGSAAIIGTTCHDSLELAAAAGAAGADYVAFGRFFASSTKPDAPPAPLQVLREARKSLDLPIAAIGGVNRGNAESLLREGADLLASIHGIFGAKDPGMAARELVRIHAASFPPLAGGSAASFVSIRPRSDSA